MSLTNGDFSNGLTGWFAMPATTLALDAASYGMTAPACKVTRGDVTDNGLWNEFAAIAARYAYRFRFKATAGVELYAQFNAYAPVNLNKVVPLVGTGQWQYVSGHWDIPAAAAADFGVYFNRFTPAAGSFFHVDDFVVAPASAPIDRVLVAGVELNDALVAYAFTFRHGRPEFDAGPTPSAATLSMVGVSRATLVKAGDTVVVEAAGAPRFTGDISDVFLDDDVLELTAIGRVSRLGRLALPAASLPAELASARLETLFADAGLAAPNLIPNGDFEANISGWAGGSATISRSPEQAKRGSYSVKSFCDATGFCFLRTDAITPTAGTAYAVSVWVYGPAGLSMQLGVWDADFTGVLGVNFVATGAWQKVSGTFTCVSTETHYLYVARGAGAVGDTFYADVAQMAVTPWSTPAPVVALDTDPMLGAREREETTALAEINRIVETIGAAVYDDAAGIIHVESLNARGGTVVALDPGVVAYAPRWAQTDEVENTVEATGAADISTSVTAADSLARYGPREGRLETDLANPADLTARATERLTRRAFPRWHIPALLLLEHDPRVVVGSQVGVSSLPASAPYPRFEPIVEGWAETITPDDWQMQLTLSDPVLSGLTLVWASVTATLKWSAAVGTWAQATSNPEIGG